MAKIPLTIDPNYCKSWGFWEGARELIQNAKDAEEYSFYKMSIEHKPRSEKLTIANEGVVVPAATLLLLGATSKEGSEQRGKFGEGFALGCLALARAGHAVTIYNGDEVWRPIIEKAEDGVFAGQELLVFQTRKLGSARGALTIEIEAVTADIWAATKELFLFLEPPADNDIVKTSSGCVLLSDKHKGRIFAKGIFVKTVEDVEYGYDLHNAMLDRDRRMLDEWDLKYRLSEALKAAYEKLPERFAPKLYEMAKAGKKDTESLQYHADAKMLQALRTQYEAEHGDAMPVSDMQESRALELVGARTAVVNKTLKVLLQKSGLDADVEKTRRQNSVKEQLGWSELTEAEAFVCTNLVERVTKEYAIVHFHNETLAVNNLKDEKMGIARWALSSNPAFLLKAIAEKEASRTSGARDMGTILAEALLTALNMPIPVRIEPEKTEPEAVAF